METATVNVIINGMPSYLFYHLGISDKQINYLLKTLSNKKYKFCETNFES